MYGRKRFGSHQLTLMWYFLMVNCSIILCRLISRTGTPRVCTLCSFVCWAFRMSSPDLYVSEYLICMCMTCCARCNTLVTYACHTCYHLMYVPDAVWHVVWMSEPLASSNASPQLYLKSKLFPEVIFRNKMYWNSLMVCCLLYLDMQ